MILANTLYLIGLLGLLIPITIHLWSKKTRKKISFGSLQFLQATETTTMKTIRPNDLLLLILRIIIVTLVVAILCQPMLQSTKLKGHAYVIDPSYGTHPSVLKLADTLQKESLFSFLPGLPCFLGATKFEKEYSKWNVLKEINDLPFQKITILSPRLVQEFLGEKMESNKNLVWVSLPESNQPSRKVGKFVKDNLVYALTADADTQITSFGQRLSHGQAKDSLHLNVFIQADEKYKDLKANIEATLSAIDNSSIVSIHLVDERRNADWSFLLNDVLENIGEYVFFLDHQETKISEVSKNIYSLSHTPNTKEFLAKNLHLAIEDIMIKDLIDTSPFDQRQLPMSSFSVNNMASEAIPHLMSLESWIWMTLIFFILLERALAYNLHKN